MDPRDAQERVLERLLEGYARTEYGSSQGAREGLSVEEYWRAFPVVRYRDLELYIERVLRGEWWALLPEPPEWFGATSGTRGIPKLIPITPSDVRDRLRVMARGMEVLSRSLGVRPRGACLCVYFPSRVVEVRVGGRTMPCGYISGIYAALFERMGFPVKPPVREMDAIGDGVSAEDWRRRFELVYKHLRDAEVGFAIGSAYALYLLGKYLEGRGCPPRELWDLEFMLCAGEPYISDYYSKDLRKLYGRDVVVVEAYGATEGMFAMQLGEEPYLTPFYDVYFFEVRVGGRVKMLYEMRAGEVGSLIISTKVLPRYEIGDLVRCYEDGRLFRVLGRDTLSNRLVFTAWSLLEHALSLF